MPEFTLDSEVDLDRTRWLTVRREQSWIRHTSPWLKEVPTKFGFGFFGLKGLPAKTCFQNDIICGITLPTWLPQIPAAGVMVPPSTGTGSGPPLKQAFETALNAPDLRRS